VRSCVRFASFVFDPGRRELRRGEEPLALPPKAFELLSLLLERRPEAVSKAEIRDRVWPGTIVSDASLPRLVNAIRAALGDSPDRPSFVRTVRGFGYAFCGETEEKAPPLRPAAAHLVWGERRVPLQEGASVVGRDAGADVWLDAATVSRRHARLVVTEDGATLEDLGSKNGTWIGTERVRGRHPLAQGDAIRLGEVRVTFRRLASHSTTRTASDRKRSR